MGVWSRASRTHVGHMTAGDFYANEVSMSMPKATLVSIVLHQDDGTLTTLKASLPLEQGEVIDATFLSVKALQEFYESEIDDARESDLLLSLHLKATMMKVSDPIMFGHCIRVFYKAAFEKHGELLQRIGANPNLGLSSIYETLVKKLKPEEAAAVKADFEACYENQPWLAMVDSDKGITNLHAPNDIIIDASMPVVARDSGKVRCWFVSHYPFCSISYCTLFYVFYLFILDVESTGRNGRYQVGDLASHAF